MTRFLGMDGNLNVAYDVDVNWVTAWNQRVVSNDFINAETGLFDPRHMMGASNQVRHPFARRSVSETALGRLPLALDRQRHREGPARQLHHASASAGRADGLVRRGAAGNGLPARRPSEQLHLRPPADGIVHRGADARLLHSRVRRGSIQFTLIAADPSSTTTGLSPAA